MMWTYWEGPQPLVVRRCVERALELYPGAVRVLGPDDVPPHLRGLRPVTVLTDVMRLWWLHEHGGAWMDADVWFLERWDYEQDLELYDLVVFDAWGVQNVLLAGNPITYAVGFAYTKSLRSAARHGTASNALNTLTRREDVLVRRDLRMLKNHPDDEPDPVTPVAVHIGHANFDHPNVKTMLGL